MYSVLLYLIIRNHIKGLPNILLRYRAEISIIKYKGLNVFTSLTITYSPLILREYQQSFLQSPDNVGTLRYSNLTD